MKLLEEEGIAFDRVDYFVEPLNVAALTALLQKGELRPRDVLRTREKEYRELGLDDESVDDAALIAAMVEYPGLLQRPIVVRGDRAVLARPIDHVRELF